MDKKICSPDMLKYFEYIDDQIALAYKVAEEARKKGLDPEDEVPVPLSADMAERVERLISVLYPQIVNCGVAERLKELEETFSSLDWRVALTIANEVAHEKFCKFNNQKEAIECGIRVGLAYLTMGTVSSPLEGFLEIKIRKRKDGKEYWAVFFGGPIRSAGGTMEAVCVLIADYLRKQFGYDTYDPTPEEVKRYITELYDYHERITNLQYLPSEEEIEFLAEKLPVQVDGDPSEQIEVSNYKDLPRVEGNNLRNGMCLVFGEGIAQKATKLWGQINTWGKEFGGLDDWWFMGEFVDLQKKIKAKAKKSDSGEKPKIMADYTFIKDLVAGRPVFTHPMRVGGFRLRYGRSRTSGFSAYCVHPATMYVVNQYLATGTQLKLERPGKATSISACDTIDGPIVKLKNGSVVYLGSLDDSKKYYPSVDEIIFLGDILINYGDFANRKHSLVPSGYCPEWWVLELEKAIVTQFGSLDFNKAGSLSGVSAEVIEACTKNAITHKISVSEAFLLASNLNVPLHPYYTYHWKTVSCDDVKKMRDWLLKGQLFEEDSSIQKLVVTLEEEPKRVLELLGASHDVVNGYVVIDGENAFTLNRLLVLNKPDLEFSGIVSDTGLDFVASISKLIIRDKSGTFIGARMGRPEKAKQRELTGSPQVLFPVGDEGGRLRSFQSALGQQKVTGDFPTMFCEKCNLTTIYRTCERCNSRTIQQYYCRLCAAIKGEICEKHGPCQKHKNMEINITHYFSLALKKLNMVVYPDLIKGVRGTANKTHIPERLEKGILRAKHEIYVNKDGTTRYDMTQLVITHFTPEEVGASVEKLRSLNYEKDIYGKDLVSPVQILELKPQDIVLPSLEPPFEGADSVLFKTANFIDDELKLIYNLPPFYNLVTSNDLIGHIVICLAPHTSAAIAARIIGFSKTQGFFAHPMIHAAQRRDCDGDESCVCLIMDALLNFSRNYLSSHRGSTQDAPLVLTSRLVPSEVDDMAFDLDTVWKYPIEMYEAALEYKSPSEVKIEQLKQRLGTVGQYEGMGFTHHISNINNTVPCSAYKTLPSMAEKILGQMEIARKIRAVTTEDVARLIIEKHFLKDTKGNLRKFSMQEFRCVSCNEKFRRPPLLGKCTQCKGKIIFTISEGSVIKYLQPTIDLAKQYLGEMPYLCQTIDVLQRRVEGTFGKEKERQEGLGKFFA